MEEFIYVKVNLEFIGNSLYWWWMNKEEFIRKLQQIQRLCCEQEIYGCEQCEHCDEFVPLIRYHSLFIHQKWKWDSALEHYITYHHATPLDPLFCEWILQQP